MSFCKISFLCIIKQKEAGICGHTKVFFYQIYPLGFCGAPFENDGVLEHRITKIADWIPHIKKLGANAIYFSPLFESDTHGYNTRDYKKIDVRLGDNEDFKNLCKDLHNNGIKAVVDGVFNSRGRGFSSISGCMCQ